MFRVIAWPIIRSIRLYNAACVMKTPNELSDGGLARKELEFLPCQTTG